MACCTRQSTGSGALIGNQRLEPFLSSGEVTQVQQYGIVGILKVLIAPDFSVGALVKEYVSYAQLLPGYGCPKRE